ncbi:hypothetical protein RHGRI_010399 [Rhododendron griersonianum]|uniref:Uncharacterized protein n=1 Tax=Rhododendron griersonianum TaxID=479676 RepID=A0AAV6KJ02_9ERIC|nr:hypothetical protein RHGRI_010399 [Rhododendron griersonianum]
MAKEKQQGTVADKGRKKITTTGKGKKNSCPAVQVLRERNTGVVICDEHDINLMRLRAVPNNNVPSKAALAQRARRDWKRNEKLYSASPRERGQQLRRERERFIQPLEPIYFPLLTPCRRPYSCFEQRTNQPNVNPSAPKR